MFCLCIIHLVCFHFCNLIMYVYKNFNGRIVWYRFFYPHTFRDLVFPLWHFFSLHIYKKPIFAAIVLLKEQKRKKMYFSQERNSKPLFNSYFKRAPEENLISLGSHNLRLGEWWHIKYKKKKLLSFGFCTLY